MSNKVTRDMLPEPSAIIPGYTSYYTFTRHNFVHEEIKFTIFIEIITMKFYFSG